MIRGVGILLILSATGIVGFTMAGHVQRQKYMLRDFHSALILMRGEISFNRPPLPGLCRLVADSLTTPTAAIFQMIADQLDKDVRAREAFCQVMSQHGVAVEPLRIWSDLAGAFTRFDPAQLERMTDSAIDQMAQLYQQAETSSVQTIRLCRTFGLCAGIVVVILLL